jgi:hypothetical protein
MCVLLLLNNLSTNNVHIDITYIVIVVIPQNVSVPSSWSRSQLHLKNSKLHILHKILTVKTLVDTVRYQRWLLQLQYKIKQNLHMC